MCGSGSAAGLKSSLLDLVLVGVNETGCIGDKVNSDGGASGRQGHSRGHRIARD